MGGLREQGQVHHRRLRTGRPGRPSPGGTPRGWRSSGTDGKRARGLDTRATGIPVLCLRRQGKSPRPSPAGNRRGTGEAAVRVVLRHGLVFTSERLHCFLPPLLARKGQGPHPQGQEEHSGDWLPPPPPPRGLQLSQRSPPADEFAQRGTCSGLRR